MNTIAIRCAYRRYVLGSSGIVYIDPAILRRQTNPTVVLPTNQDSTVSMSTTTSQLARAFGVVMRQVADLIMMLQDYHALAPNLPRVLDITHQDSVDLQVYLECRLKPTWDWLITIMDATEAQLRFGSVLSSISSSAHPMHVMYAGPRGIRTGDPAGRDDQRTVDNTRRAKTATDGNSARRDFLMYMMSLMRTHNNEHADSLPATDVSALKHVAYVLDAMIYYMRSGSESEAETLRDTASVQSWQDPEDNLNDDGDDDPVNQSINMETDSLDGESDAGTKSGRRHTFFQRSDSTMFLGCIPPDPFQVSLADALPLAEQPHLLHPYSRKEELFGMPRQTVSAQALPLDAELGEHQALNQPLPMNRLPTHMALSFRTSNTPPGPSFVYQPPVIPGHSELQIPSYATPPAPPAHSLSGHQGNSAVDMSNFASNVIISSPVSAPQQLTPTPLVLSSSSEGPSYLDSNLVSYAFPMTTADVASSSAGYGTPQASSVHPSSIPLPLPAGNEPNALFDVSDLSTEAHASLSMRRPGESSSGSQYPRAPPYAISSLLQDSSQQSSQQPQLLSPHHHHQQQQQQQSQHALGQPSVIVHAGSTVSLSYYQAPLALPSGSEGAEHGQDDVHMASSSSEMGLDLSNPSRNVNAGKATLTSEAPDNVR